MVSILKTDKIQASHGSTIEIPSGHKISGAAGSIVAPGNVIQVVSGTAATETALTSTSFVASGTSVSITPTSTSSKILVSAVLPIQSGTSGNITYTLYRGSTNLGNSTYGMGRFYDPATRDTNATIIILDSPSTTSATTYQIYIKVSGGTHYYNIANEPSHIVAQEIAQ